MSALAMPRSRWPKPRIFMLGFFVGRGLAVDDVADRLDSTVHTVRTMTNNMGGAFSDVPRGNLMIELPPHALAKLEGQAKRRQRSVEGLAGTVMRLCAEDPTLLDNVLDDEV